MLENLISKFFKISKFFNGEVGRGTENALIHGRSAKLNVFSVEYRMHWFSAKIFLDFGILIRARFGFGSIWFNLGTLIGTCYESNIIVYLNRIRDYNTTTKYTVLYITKIQKFIELAWRSICQKSAHWQQMTRVSLGTWTQLWYLHS